MMIARKLLAACAPRSTATQTVLLSTWTSATPEIGSLTVLQGSVSGGTLTVPAGSGVFTELEPTIPAVTGDWLLEFFCYGSAPPIVLYGGSGVPLVYYGSMHIGGQSALIPPLLVGANHFAMGVQAGIAQAWVNGARIINGGSMCSPPFGLNCTARGLTPTLHLRQRMMMYGF